jgi:hypothetical protein
MIDLAIAAPPGRIVKRTGDGVSHRFRHLVDTVRRGAERRRDRAL